MKQVIGIIGYGNMGSAIAQRLKSEYQIWAFDQDKNKTKNLPDINIADNAIDLVNKVDAVILAVKPQDFDTVLMQIKEYIKAKLVISIAAGISTGYIENQLGKIRVIRVMPNLPVKIGKGMICLCRGDYSSKSDLDFTQRLFDYLGKTMLIEENLMNAATAISGSGPGYYFHTIELNLQDYKNNSKTFQDKFINKLIDAAKEVGFKDREAKFLAHWTVVYSDLLLQKTNLTPGQLRKQVTSKGGTTEAALTVLANGGLLVDAVKAAVKRAEELSRE